jgi:hypothetical protein
MSRAVMYETFGGPGYWSCVRFRSRMRDQVKSAFV